jgi:DNA-binding IscR family transcriptional regulator
VRQVFGQVQREVASVLEQTTLADLLEVTT